MQEKQRGQTKVTLVRSKVDYYELMIYYLLGLEHAVSPHQIHKAENATLCNKLPASFHTAT